MGTVLVAVQLTLLALAGAANAQSPSTDCVAATVAPMNASMRPAAAAAVLCLVNGERAARRLAPVMPSLLLTQAATAHSVDMVRRRYFSHVTPSGLDQRGRVARTGYLRGCRRPALGETIAWGSGDYGSPIELVKNLMASPPHRSIILDGRYREVGVGLALGAPMAGVGDFGTTLSLNFGRR
ncbi:MAG TPA: CAP domain-containing protein [Solirubrobacteraceae bacterium]|jgi:uncharacterized protein YkwD|nr:CAP domain-containing protein [Solirubrobacteraceae bacterium]